MQKKEKKKNDTDSYQSSCFMSLAEVQFLAEGFIILLMSKQKNKTIMSPARVWVK